MSQVSGLKQTKHIRVWKKRGEGGGSSHRYGKGPEKKKNPAGRGVAIQPPMQKCCRGHGGGLWGQSWVANRPNRKAKEKSETSLHPPPTQQQQELKPEQRPAEPPRGVGSQLEQEGRTRPSDSNCSSDSVRWFSAWLQMTVTKGEFALHFKNNCGRKYIT